MAVLIVDDEELLINDVLASVDWKKLGITEKYTAHNIQKAKEILENHRIDILLCDIEMPQGNGLDLLAWVQEHSPFTQPIILTCHIDFGYAKKALKLGSIDYILKPIQYDELEAAIIKAQERIKNQSYLVKYSQYGQFWLKYQPLVIEHFWLNIINQVIRPDPVEIKKAAQHYNIPLDENIKVLPILLSVKRWEHKYSLPDQKAMVFGIKNIAMEVIVENLYSGQVIELPEDKIIIILFCGGESFDLNKVQERCMQCVSACHKHLKCDIMGYIGKPSHIHELSKIVDALKDMDTDNVSYVNRIFTIGQSIKNNQKIEPPPFTVWSALLQDGKYDEFGEAVITYLNKPDVKANMNGSELKLFFYSLINIIYQVMKENGISVSNIEEKYTDLLDNNSEPYRSISDMTAWIDYAVKVIKTSVQNEYLSANIVDSVKEFIDSNLDKEYTREDIALKFFINPDYLDRIFKKKVGTSVTKYILYQRILHAKKLLEETNTPVSVIATSLGYKNMSHFSYVFKKYTKQSPSTYRELCGKVKK